MRIIYVSSTRLPSTEANGVHVMRMADAFASLGHDVCLVTRDGAPAMDDDAVRMSYGVRHHFDLMRIDVPAGRGTGPRYAHAAARAVAGLGPIDVAYGRDPAALRRIGSLATVVGYEAHAPAATRWRAVLEWRLQRLVNFGGEVVITAALAGLRSRDDGRRSVSRIVLPDGADVPPTAARGTAGGNHVGYVGHLYEGRGVEMLVEVARRIPELTLTVVGGLDVDVERCRRAAPSNVRFTGHVAPNALPDHFVHFDVAVAPYQRVVKVAGGVVDSSAWMSPLKIFEYMSWGLPLVASDLPVIREVLVDGENALLVPPDDFDGWTRAVRRLMDDPALRMQLGGRGRALIEERYSWQRRAQAVLRHLGVG